MFSSMPVRWKKHLTAARSRVALVGWAFVFLKPILWVIDVVGNYDFLLSNKTAIGSFLSSGLGTLICVVVGALIIGTAIVAREKKDAASINYVPNVKNNDAPKSLLEMFKSDFADCTIFPLTQSFPVPNDAPVQIQTHVYANFAANSIFIAHYIPRDKRAVEVLKMLAHVSDVPIHRLEVIGFDTTFKPAGQSSRIHLSDLRFTRLIYLYHEDDFTPQQIAEIHSAYEAEDLKVILRGSDYKAAKQMSEKIADQSTS